MNELKTQIKNEIIADLGDNYTVADSDMLSTLLDDSTTDALNISNREETTDNVTLLKSEIKKCVKTRYLQRGTEDVRSLGESGKSSTFIDSYEILRNDIVKNGKRVMVV